MSSLDHFFLELQTLKASTDLEGLVAQFSEFVPHFSEISPENRDSNFRFLSQFSAAQREDIRAFFSTSWAKFVRGKLALDSIAAEVILIASLRFSGLYDNQFFAQHFEDFQTTYGYCPLELILDMDDEASGYFPGLFFMRWLMICFVGFGMPATAKLLSAFCWRHDESYFDLEKMWFGHDDFFEKSADLSLGALIVATEALAKELQIEVTMSPDFPIFYPVFPVADLPDEE